MKQTFQTFLPIFAAMVAILMLNGCSTSRINWDSRIGNYSFDQAIVDMGPPERSAQLSDGRTVAEWLTFRGRSGNHYSPGFYTPFYGGYHHRYGGSWYHSEPSFPDQFMRLTFSQEGRLQSWKRFAK